MHTARVKIRLNSIFERVRKSLPAAFFRQVTSDTERNLPAKIFVNFFTIISTTERVDNSLYFPYTSAVVRASVKALW